MIKNALMFLAGTVVSTVIVVLAGGRPAAFVGLGLLLALSIAAGVLWLTGVRRLARFLNAFADGLALIGSGCFAWRLGAFDSWHVSLGSRTDRATRSRRPSNGIGFLKTRWKST